MFDIFFVTNINLLPTVNITFERKVKKTFVFLSVSVANVSLEKSDKTRQNRNICSENVYVESYQQVAKVAVG